MFLLLLGGVVSGALWEELRCTGKFVIMGEAELRVHADT
jgi:hypothetical protein